MFVDFDLARLRRVLIVPGPTNQPVHGRILTIPSLLAALRAAGSQMLVTAPLYGCQKLDIAWGDAGKVYRTYAQ